MHHMGQWTRAMAVRVAVDDGVRLAVQLAEHEMVGVGVGEGDAVGELVIVQLGECVFGGGGIALPKLPLPGDSMRLRGPPLPSSAQNPKSKPAVQLCGFLMRAKMYFLTVQKNHTRANCLVHM